MDRPSWYPFRDAAMRADANDLRAREGGLDTAPTTGTAATRERVVSDTGVVAHAEPPVERRRFSLGATFLGWCVAAFFTLVFVAVLAVILGGAGANLAADSLTATDIQGLAIGNFIGYLVATFLAYLIGGYAAGRIALWDGVKHGALTVAWALLFAILALVAGAALADAAGLGAATLPVDLASITAIGIVASLLVLVAMLAGAAWGGAIGERYHDRAHGHAPRRRTLHRTRTRGRPL